MNGSVRCCQRRPGGVAHGDELLPARVGDDGRVIVRRRVGVAGLAQELDVRHHGRHADDAAGVDLVAAALDLVLREGLVLGAARLRGLDVEEGRHRHHRMVFATSVINASIASSDAIANDGYELILIVENFNQQRHGVGLAANMARHHRYRAELAHRPRVT